MTRFSIPLFCLVGFFTLGCAASKEEFPAVKLDGAEVAGKIFAEYDSDGNGELSKAEIKKNGGLAAMFDADKFQPEAILDADSSGSVSEQELTDKLNAASSTNEVHLPVKCSIELALCPVRRLPSFRNRSWEILDRLLAKRMPRDIAA